MNGLSFKQQAWSEREDEIYASLFSNMPETLYVPKNANEIPEGGELLVLSRAGVIEIPPDEGRKYWTYITSGLSNPFGDEPEEISGFGFELLFRVPQQSPWAVNVLFNLMGYVLESHNFFEQGHRMPFNAPIVTGSDSALTTLLFWPPEDMPRFFQLRSGQVELLEVMGITDNEYDYAKKVSSEALYQELKKLPSFPLTDITRS